MIPGNTEPFFCRVFRREQRSEAFQFCSTGSQLSMSGDSLLCTTIDAEIHPMRLYEYCAVPVDAYGNAGSSSDTIEVMGPGEGDITPVNVRVEKRGRPPWRSDSLEASRPGPHFFRRHFVV